jgi:hypothetical protein
MAGGKTQNVPLCRFSALEGNVSLFVPAQFWRVPVAVSLH